MPDLWGMVDYVRAVRSLVTRRLPRLTAPAWIAVVCVLGLVAGVTVAVATRGPAEPRVAAASPASPIASLPKVAPSKNTDPVYPGASMKADFAVPAVQLTARSVAPLSTLRQADLLIVSATSLPATTLHRVLRQSGVTSAEQIEAVRMKLNGSYTAVLGVDPSAFRSYAERPTASSNALWNGVSDGGIAVSYTMGTNDHLKLGGTVRAAGKTNENLRVVAFGTMGIGGVDAVVSDTVARSLGMPAGNAIVVSASSATDLTRLARTLGKLLPSGASVESLVRVVSTGAAASSLGSSSASTALASAEVTTMLRAAYSRLGMPYVWGAAGPRSFDCSGLVQWSFAQAGVRMPRVAADQALTGASVPISGLEPGDLLFYHTDPSAPHYISHVTIFLGNGWMIQAPHTGLNVEVVPVSFGSEYAGAVRVDPALAAQVASSVA